MRVLRRIGAAAALLITAITASGASARPMMDMGPSLGQTAPVTIEFTAFRPARVGILAGDTVRWGDVSRTHTVTEANNAWSSPQLGIGDSYSRQFNHAEVVHYYCQIHPFMEGEVDVFDVLLSVSSAPAAPGKLYPLRGRAALPEGSTVTIEGSSGSAGFTPVATASVGPDGSFVASLRPTATMTYRAVSGEMASPTVLVRVLDRRVLLRDSRRGGTDNLTVHVTPAAPGGTVVLQLHLKERFGWWPEVRRRLDENSTARFALHLDRRVNARVALTLPDGATELALSQAVLVGTRARS
jgi:plastocyanin